MPNPVGFFEIYVSDMPKAKAFYEAVFGVELFAMTGEDAPEGVEMLFFPMDEQDYGAPGALVTMPQFAGSGTGTLVYFNSKDCQIEQDAAVKAGGKVMRPKFSIGKHGMISIIVDLDGNFVGIHSPAER